MARKKKNGRRAEGIQARNGWLYIIRTQSVIKDGKKSYEKKWISTGLTDITTNIAKASEMRRAILSSVNTALSVDRDTTVTEYVDLFLAKKKRTVSDTTYSGYHYRGNRIKEFFGSIKVKGITQANIEQFLDYLITDCKCQTRTVEDVKVLFGSIIEQAVKDGLLAFNPVKEATIDKNLVMMNAKEKNDGEDFFSYQEARHFLEIVESHPLYELFFVTLFFGLRREEVLGLRWASVNFNKKEFRINHTVTKGMNINRKNSTKTESSLRTYPLTEEQVKMFRHLLDEEKKNRELFGNCYQDNDYIFKHQDGKPYYPDYPTKAFGKVIAKHPELPQSITLHGLRSSCVSILIHEGFDVKSIQKWVGHADINTTLKIYAKVKDKEAKQEILSGMNTIIQPKVYEET